MPLPKDERVLALANDLVEQFDQLFGVHPGFRPAHAKGLMLTGTFKPALDARSLTKAPHLWRPSTPVTARFSNSTGLPQIPDSAPDANPRGFAIRFNLAEHVHTDIVSHSIDGFPARDGREFLELLRAVAASGADTPSPKPIEKFLGTHPGGARLRPGSQALSLKPGAGNLFWRNCFCVYQFSRDHQVRTVPHRAGRRRRFSNR